jgi:hypothetical protein
LVAGEQGGVYRVIRASVALAPLSAESCGAGDDVAPTAPVSPVSRATRHGVRFRSEFQAPVAELRGLAASDCRFGAMLYFARLPYFTPPRGAVRYAGDLRYDRVPGMDFSDIELPARPTPQGCPRWVPGWRRPRAELFD